MTQPFNWERNVTEEDQAKEKYGITQETETTFHFAGHKYQRLDDAIAYAKTHQHLRNAANDNTAKRT